MTWREAAVIRILILIAKMIAGEDSLRADLKALENHLAYLQVRKESA